MCPAFVAAYGPPTPYGDCRTPFRSALVGAYGKRKSMKNLLCPRCTTAKKAQKKSVKPSD